MRVAAVRAQVAILGAAEVAPAVLRAQHTLDDALAILGMDVRLPVDRSRLAADWNAEHLLESRASPNGVRLQVGVPDRVARCLCEQPESFFADPRRFARLALLRHVVEVDR